jgi:acylphosphatase
MSILKWCKKGPPIANVTNVDVTWENYKGEFSSFDITY